MTTFQQLKRVAREADGCHKTGKMAVLGDCATQMLCTAIKGYGYERKLNMDVFEADYNLIDALIIDDDSELYRYTPDYVLFVMCAEKLYEAFCETDTQQRSYFAKTIYQKIENYWNTVLSHGRIQILQYNFVERDDNIWGNFSTKMELSFIFQLRVGERDK